MKKSIGHRFGRVIGDALEQSRDFVLICTPTAMKRKWVICEAESFYDQFHMGEGEEERRFFILKGKGYVDSLNEKLPTLMRNLQRADSIEEIIKKLVKSDSASTCCGSSSTIRYVVCPSICPQRMQDIVFVHSDYRLIVRVNMAQDRGSLPTRGWSPGPIVDALIGGGSISVY